MTLLEAVNKNILEECFDIYDEDWDWCVAIDLWLDDSSGERAPSDRFIEWLARNLEWISGDSTSCVCNAAEFMWEHREVFNPFFEENNVRWARPSAYKHLDPDEDSGFFEVYLCSLESLIVGNYSDEDYSRLLNAFNVSEQ